MNKSKTEQRKNKTFARIAAKTLLQKITKKNSLQPTKNHKKISLQPTITINNIVLKEFPEKLKIIIPSSLLYMNKLLIWV